MAERQRRTAAQLLGRATVAGADEALATLIGQFADPYSFLRELIQNALDAGSTQIDVELAFAAGSGGAPGLGVATITVLDNGEGMNEHVIDNYLLTLFASTKEHDLTKIGKFGIGFVSIFAIEPDLVVVETGQAGEAWRLLFHANARYEKLRIADEAVEGTRVTLHKRVDARGFAELQRRCRATVCYWCKLAEAEIAVDGQPIREPFALDADLVVEYREPGTEILVGFARPARGDDGALAAGAAQPLVGFYNRGLTLIETDRVPGEHADLAGLSLRVKSRYLEHTLTRDNVLQDESFSKALALLRHQVTQVLRPRLAARIAELAARPEAAEAGDAPALDACLRYAALPAMSLGRWREGAELRLPITDGEPLSLKALRRVRSPVGALLVAARRSPLTSRLAAAGVPTLRGLPGVGEYLEQVAGLHVVDVDEALFTAVPVEQAPSDEALLAAVNRALRSVGLRVSRVVLGDLAYAESSRVAGQLFARQREAFGVTSHGEGATLLGGAREIVLNSAHPLVQSCRRIAAADPALAALLCAQAVNALERGDARKGSALAVRALQARIGAADGG